MGFVPPRIIRPFSRGYQPTDTPPEQNPPQSVSGIFTPAERVMAPQSYDPNKSTYVPPLWGVTMEQAAAALAMLAGVPSVQYEPIWENSEGIALVGYEEL